MLVVLQNTLARFLFVLVCACFLWLIAELPRKKKEVYRLDSKKRR